MTIVLVAYNLKKDVTKEQYYNFSQKLDQPKTPTIRGVRSFKPVEIKGSDQDELPYQIIEVIDVESWERWENGENVIQKNRNYFQKPVRSSCRERI